MEGCLHFFFCNTQPPFPECCMVAEGRLHSAAAKKEEIFSNFPLSFFRSPVVLPSLPPNAPLTFYFDSKPRKWGILYTYHNNNKDSRESKSWTASFSSFSSFSSLRSSYQFQQTRRRRVSRVVKALFEVTQLKSSCQQATLSTFRPDGWKINERKMIHFKAHIFWGPFDK